MPSRSIAASVTHDMIFITRSTELSEIIRSSAMRRIPPPSMFSTGSMLNKPSTRLTAAKSGRNPNVTAADIKFTPLPAASTGRLPLSNAARGLLSILIPKGVTLISRGACPGSSSIAVTCPHSCSSAASNPHTIIPLRSKNAARHSKAKK